MRIPVPPNRTVAASRVRAVCAFAVLAALPARAERHFLVLAGQSNMEGKSAWAGQGFPDSIPEIRTWSAFGGHSGSWMALQPGTSFDTSTFGPELTLGMRLHAALPKDSFFLVKVAFGGTTLATDWLPPSCGGPGPLYDLLRRLVAEARPEFESNTLVLDGFFWMQGESDAVADSTARAYATRLDSFIVELRRDWGDSVAPWVIGLIDDQPTWPYANLVREAQTQAETLLPRVGLVETVGLGTDGVHYDAEGTKQLGRLFADRWLELKGLKSPTRAERRRIRVFSTVSGLYLQDDGSAAVLRYRLLQSGGAFGNWHTRRPGMRVRIDVPHSNEVLLLQVQFEDGQTEAVKLPPLLP